jgi:hypothetical protein
MGDWVIKPTPPTSLPTNYVECDGSFIPFSKANAQFYVTQLASGKLDEIWVPIRNSEFSVVGAISWKGFNHMALDKSISYTIVGSEHVLMIPDQPLTEQQGMVFKLSTNALVPTLRTQTHPALCYGMLSLPPSKASLDLSIVFLLEELITGQSHQLEESN